MIIQKLRNGFIAGSSFFTPNILNRLWSILTMNPGPVTFATGIPDGVELGRKLPNFEVVFQF